MKTFHIEIDIDKDGDMFICEDNCTGEHYHVDGSFDDMIDQIGLYLNDYLHCEHEYDSEVEYWSNESDKILGKNDIPDKDLKNWQKEVMKADIKDGHKAFLNEVNKLHNIGYTAKDIADLYNTNESIVTDGIKELEKHDPVNHPSHYTDGKIEVIDFIEDKNLGFHLGNAVKYISRAGKKDPSKKLEDLKKAQWYLNRMIGRLEGDKEE